MPKDKTKRRNKTRDKTKSSISTTQTASAQLATDQSGLRGDTVTDSNVIVNSILANSNTRSQGYLFDSNDSTPAIGKTKRRPSLLREVKKQNLAQIEKQVAQPQVDLLKIKNPDVRKEAEKINARIAKFEAGLHVAQSEGIIVFRGMNVAADLQHLFELADANDDPDLLKQFSAATSFSGKLSIFQPTSKSGRAQVRLSQLFNALQGDRNDYKTVSDNIQNLATEQKVLRKMARDANLLQGLDKAQYLDEHRLLRLVLDKDNAQVATPINETTREWHLAQASLMKAYREAEGTNPDLQKRLALTLLQSFAKAAPYGDQKSDELGAQVTPLFNTGGFYHRSATKNPMLEKVTTKFSSDMGLSMGSVQLLDNANYREVLAREFVMSGVNSKVDSLDNYKKAVDDLLVQVKNGVIPENDIVLDISGLYAQRQISAKEVLELRDELEQVFLTKAEAFLQANSEVDKNTLTKMMQKLQIAATTKYKQTDVLLTPSFLFQEPKVDHSDVAKELLSITKSLKPASHAEFFDTIAHSLIHSGYRPDPIQLRRAWLEVETPAKILQQSGIQMSELATSDKATPKVFSNIGDLAKHNTFKNFSALANQQGNPPYVTVLSKATATLLQGMSDNKDLDRAMKDQGLDDILQTGYFRILNAMATAVDKQDNFVEFMNQLEVMHQEIATIISLAEPHNKDAFEKSVQDMLSDPKGPNNRPVIPKGLDKPSVQMKASSMHTLSSILSSVENLKDSNELNVCILKDHYYESAGAVTAAQTYSVSSLDGDSLRTTDSSVRALDPNSIAGKKPLDVYVCDFHHNISMDRNHYQMENLQHQVDELYRNKLVADKFTVAIDSTIDFVNSKDIQAFLEHNKARIQAGELNVVLFRSAQKFDMLGMDNYYGGFAVNVNDHASFAGFNKRMALADDQSTGPSRQGLSNIVAHAGKETDAYRSALIQSTKRFYDGLPPQMIWSNDSTSAMQIAKNSDPNSVFLDIKFPNNENASEAFRSRLKAFAEEKGLPLTSRASFGFATTNVNIIHGEKTRLTPGLEGDAVQDRYIAFFKAAHETANQAAAEASRQGLQDDAYKKFIADKIQQMKSPD
ncbi:MAG: hypothetical protein OEY38_17950 [Gammaproteobacteria bacterium]|nr:hypothetical protein [Gammaproteobacteria bacterium]